MRNISFKWKILILVFITIIFISSIITIGSIVNIKNISEENIEFYRTDAYSKKENELKNYVSIAMKMINIYYKQIENETNIQLIEKAKKEALFEIKNIKYDKNGFFWVADNKNTIIMIRDEDSHGIGKNLDIYKDSDGKEIFTELIEKSRINTEGGSLKFLWGIPSKKRITYVKNFKEWDWILGTVVFIDDIEENITIMKKDTEDKIKSIIFSFSLSVLILSIVILLLVSFLSTKFIIEPMKSFQNSLLDFFKYLNKESQDVKFLEVNSTDEIGLMAKAVNENIAKSKISIEEDENTINDSISVLSEFQNGDLSQRVNVNSSNPALLKLTILLNSMADKMELNINSVLDILDKYSHYNYTSKVETTALKQHFYKLANGVNYLGESITSMLIENRTNGLTLQDSSNTLLLNMQTLTNSSNDAAMNLEDTVSSLEEITANITSNTQNIIQMANHANEVTLSASLGEKQASQTIAAMDEINEQVSSINEAITVIDQIAFQTNILSLNAAVEASTAGEAGKGFAVVAQEVRNLASRSSEAANDIKKLVENATLKANAGKKISDEMIIGYGNLNKTISKTIKLISNVETASKEQQLGIEQINNAVNLLEQRTYKNVSIAKKTEKIAIKTQNLANEVVHNSDTKEYLGK